MEKNEILNLASSVNPTPKNRSFYERISFWIGIVGTITTLVLTIVNANTKMKIDQREADLKELEVKLRERSTGVEESKERVERYKWVFSLFPNLSGTDAQQKNFTINLVRLALTKDEAQQLFTGLQASPDPDLQSLGQNGINVIENEPISVLVSQMNAGTADVRKHAVAMLIQDYKSSSQAITLTLRMYDPGNANTLSASGVINALYFLGSTDPEAWNKELILEGRAIAKRIHDSNPGPQTQKALDTFETILKQAEVKLKY